MIGFQLNPLHVISFYMVAVEESFSKASIRLRITQPAVTQHIHAIEAQFGVKLIHVKKKRIYLTKAGQALLPYAKELFNRSVMAEEFLTGYRFNRLSMVIEGSMLFYLGPLIAKFRELHPSIMITIHERFQDASALIEKLLGRRYDVCFVIPSPFYDKRLRVYRIPTWGTNAFVVSSDYPLPSDRPITWAELSSYPLIIQPIGSAIREKVLQHFEERGLTPLIGVEVSNLLFAKKLALQKKGVALMYEPIIREEVARGDLRIIEVEDGDITVGNIDIVVHREMPSPTADIFLSVIKEHFGSIFCEIPPQ